MSKDLSSKLVTQTNFLTKLNLTQSFKKIKCLRRKIGKSRQRKINKGIQSCKGKGRDKVREKKIERGRRTDKIRICLAYI